MVDEVQERRSRRGLLLGALGGVAALASAKLAAPSSTRAGTDGDVVLGTDGQIATAVTGVESSVSDALHGKSNLGGAAGMWGEATGDWGTGVYGSSAAGDAVVGSSDRTGGAGVVGVGDYGVIGTGSVGVLGDVGAGGTGVYGFVGSVAAPVPPQSVAVYAYAPGRSHTALQVAGRVRFSRSGRLSIPAGASSVSLGVAGLTASNLIIATLQTNRAGYYVQAAVPTTDKFTIYLNKAVPATTYVAFFILN